MPKQPDTFSCDSCGRQFRWKAELAGKKAKCVCGRSIQIPQLIDPVEPEDIIAFREEDPARVISITPPQPPGPAPLGYQAVDPALKAPLDLRYDLYLPGGVLLVAALLISMHAGFQGRYLVRFLAVWFVIGVTVTPSIVAFMLFGVCNSRSLKISNGAFAFAALKILAVVLVTDVVVLFAYDYSKSVGLVRISILGALQMLISFLCAVGVTVKLSSLCIFHKQEDRFAKASFTVAALAVVLQAVLILITNSVLVGMQRARAAPATATASSASSVATSSAPPASPFMPMASDPVILHAVSQGFFVREGREWKNLRMTSNDAVDGLIDGLYAAGANKVYIDFRASLSHPMIAYVEFPADPIQHANCIAVYQRFAAASGVTSTRLTTPPGHRFTVIWLQ